MSGRLAQLERTVALVARFVDGTSLSREEVADFLGVKVAAADRQVAAIRKHFPLERRRIGKVVHWTLPLSRGHSRPSKPAVIAACLGSSLAQLFAHTNYDSAMREALGFVANAALHPATYADADRKFVFMAKGGEPALPKSRVELDELIEAILAQYRVQIAYQRSDGTNQRLRIEPLSLAVYQHQLYVIGREHHAKARPFRFSRIRRVIARTSDRFMYPEGAVYNPETLFGDSFGIFVGDEFEVAKIELRFPLRFWHLLKSHRWHQTQIAEKRRDHVLLTLKCGICPELRAWVLGFGADVRVLQPESLAHTIEQEATRMARSSERRRRRSDS